MLVNAAQQKEQFRVVIQSRAYPVECSRDVFAHIRPIGAIAGQLDFVWGREQPVVFPADSIHDALSQTALQQFHQRINSAAAILADRLPARASHGLDVDFYGV